VTPIVAVLSPRQEEVLDRLARGLELQAIARDLGIAYRTARYHVERARERLRAATTTEAVAIYVALRDREPIEIPA
jgi:DNA-binding CsgD family transcriptional regulator